MSDGLLKTARRARSIGCECLAIFGRNPRGWRARTYAPDEVAGFRDSLARSDIQPLVIHGSYLVNLASPDRGLRHRSLGAVADDMERVARLGGRFVVLHPGHHMGAGVARGLRTLAASLRWLLAGAPTSVGVLLENMAGRGTELGGDWEQFVRLLDHLGGEPRVGICFDTCHAHAAGYRLDGPRWVARALREFDQALNLERLRLIHLNDCRGPAGARQDLHEHLGKGTIGERGLRALLRRRELRSLAAILETPIQRAGDDRRNLRRAKALMAGRVG